MIKHSLKEKEKGCDTSTEEEIIAAKWQEENGERK